MVKLRTFFEIDGKPMFITGINYQSAESGHLPEFWEDESFAEIIEQDFQYMKQMGILAIRIQCAKFHRPKTFETILKYARKYGIYVMPNLNLGDLTKGDIGEWFLAQGADVVHLSEEKFQFKNEQVDPFVEPALSREKAFLKSLLSKYKDEEMILGWDICNEPTYALYGGSAVKYAQYCGKDARLARRVTSHWAKELYQAAKEADPNHPITIGGDHSILVMDTGFDIVEFSEANDFMSTHSYSRNVAGYLMIDEACSLRDTYLPSFVTQFSRVTRKPFANGECGNNSYCISEECQGLHYRIMLYSSLVNGAIGIFPWCFHEYDLNIPKMKATYESAPSETEFGIVRPEHVDKPAASEYRQFVEIVKKIDFSKYQLRRPDVGILIPKQYYDYLNEHRASLFNSFVLAKQAHLNVEFTRAGDDWSRYKLLISPSNHLLISEMDQLKDFVRKGGGLCISVTNALGGWASYLENIIGAEVENFTIAPQEITIEFQKNFGTISKGQKLTYRSDTWSYFQSHHKPENERQYLTYLQPTTAQILAVDQFGHPAILFNETGGGKVLTFVFGIEYFLSNMLHVYLEDETYKIYQTLADLCELKSPVYCDHPFVELGIFGTNDKMLLFVINHERMPLDTTLRFEKLPSKVTDFINGQSVSLTSQGQVQVHLEKNGVKVFEVVK